MSQEKTYPIDPRLQPSEELRKILNGLHPDLNLRESVHRLFARSEILGEVLSRAFPDDDSNLWTKEELLQRVHPPTDPTTTSLAAEARTTRRLLEIEHDNGTGLAVRVGALVQQVRDLREEREMLRKKVDHLQEAKDHVEAAAVALGCSVAELPKILRELLVCQQHGAGRTRKSTREISFDLTNRRVLKVRRMDDGVGEVEVGQYSMGTMYGGGVTCVAERVVDALMEVLDVPQQTRMWASGKQPGRQRVIERELHYDMGDKRVLTVRRYDVDPSEIEVSSPVGVPATYGDGVAYVVGWAASAIIKALLDASQVRADRELRRDDRRQMPLPPPNLRAAWSKWERTTPSFPSTIVTFRGDEYNMSSWGDSAKVDKIGAESAWGNWWWQPVGATWNEVVALDNEFVAAATPQTVSKDAKVAAPTLKWWSREAGKYVEAPIDPSRIGEKQVVVTVGTYEGASGHVASFTPQLGELSKSEADHAEAVDAGVTDAQETRVLLAIHDKPEVSLFSAVMELKREAGKLAEAAAEIQRLADALSAERTLLRELADACGVPADQPMTVEALARRPAALTFGIMTPGWRSLVDDICGVLHLEHPTPADVLAKIRQVVAERENARKDSGDVRAILEEVRDAVFPTEAPKGYQAITSTVRLLVGERNTYHDTLEKIASNLGLASLTAKSLCEIQKEVLEEVTGHTAAISALNDAKRRVGVALGMRVDEQALPPVDLLVTTAQGVVRIGREHEQLRIAARDVQSKLRSTLDKLAVACGLGDPTAESYDSDGSPSAGWRTAISTVAQSRVELVSERDRLRGTLRVALSPIASRDNDALAAQQVAASAHIAFKCAEIVGCDVERLTQVLRSREAQIAELEVSGRAKKDLAKLLATQEEWADITTGVASVTDNQSRVGAVLKRIAATARITSFKTDEAEKEVIECVGALRTALDVANGGRAELNAGIVGIAEELGCYPTIQAIRERARSLVAASEKADEEREVEQARTRLARLLTCGSNWPAIVETVEVVVGAFRARERERRLASELAHLVVQKGVDHLDGCSHDDTCTCPHVAAINALLRDEPTEMVPTIEESLAMREREARMAAHIGKWGPDLAFVRRQHAAPITRETMSTAPQPVQDLDKDRGTLLGFIAGLPVTWPGKTNE